MKKKMLIAIALLLIASVFVWNYIALPVSRDWNADEIALIKSMSLTRLPALSPDLSNQVGDNENAAELGYHLFFEKRMSSTANVSCATCHQPQKMFTDGLPIAIGKATGTRNTPSLVGIAHSPWFYWDGRKDSQWAQALAPIESAHEHDFSRTEVVKLLAQDDEYRTAYQSIFGALPDPSLLPDSASPLGSEQQQAAWLQLEPNLQAEVSRAFSNVGKVLAAYQRKLNPGTSRFDTYADSLSAEADVAPTSVLNGTEIAGLRLFIGKGQCVSCHNGPLLTNNEFHNTGVLSAAGQLPSMGRYDGIRSARLDSFNCLGEFSDASTEQCLELRYARDTNDLVGAHKTPTLRNITETAPYMHSGQIASLQEVLEHYNDAPISMLSHNEAKPLGLRDIELRQLEAFLQTLTAPLAIDSKWLTDPNE